MREHVSDRSGGDLLHTQDSETYRRLVQEEARYWDEHPESLLSARPLPAIQRYLNERATGRADVEWHETISDYGAFERGCVLGAGPGHVEEHLLGRHPGLHLSVFDISGEALARVGARLQASFPGRLETCQKDLNFVTLRPDSYDLVVANSCIHHLLNLEHVAFQVNRALTTDGYFFMQDTVGESYFQFSEEKKRLFKAFVLATQGKLARSGIPWPAREAWPFSPFESVRSAEILDVFGRYLREERLRTSSALLQLLLFASPNAPRLLGTGLAKQRARVFSAVRRTLVRSKPSLDRRLATGELLFALDSVFCDTGYLRPGLAFAVYRKRGEGEDHT